CVRDSSGSGFDYW
nr:immunoglobulin heavy chain junction region [Macaca mulatta]MOX60883.1 immunoglobulin heavy chain junction region [Macaca mulatta]MOX61483.1 immunoglobulin heavy chain junction region [Macaca mulatta]MOX63467.1 immunoglobulin heavy chain junction region [Macaca mulatta]MOX63868.1 immunoglobulin heavy chain junction region [Macaca mulatta]